VLNPEAMELHFHVVGSFWQPLSQVQYGMV
jgi:hypothetical protein